MSQPRQGQPQAGRAPVQRSDTQEYAIFGIAVYGVYTFARFFSRLLEAVLASDNSFFYDSADEVLWRATVSGFPFFPGGIILLLAMGIGVYYYYRGPPHEQPAKPAAIAAAAGIVVTTIVWLILALLFAPDAVNIELGDELAGVIAAVVGTPATAALSAFVLEQIQGPA